MAVGICIEPDFIAASSFGVESVHHSSRYVQRYSIVVGVYRIKTWLLDHRLCWQKAAITAYLRRLLTLRSRPQIFINGAKLATAALLSTRHALGQEMLEQNVAVGDEFCGAVLLMKVVI